MAHTFIYNGWEVNTAGNPYAHAILRGAVTADGRSVPNYHFEDLFLLAKAYEDQQLQNPSIIIDTNHANSMKRYYEQPRIAREVLMSRQYEPILTKIVITSYSIHYTKLYDVKTQTAAIFCVVLRVLKAFMCRHFIT